jgi:hypothetical protein
MCKGYGSILPNLLNTLPFIPVPSFQPLFQRPLLRPPASASPTNLRLFPLLRPLSLSHVSKSLLSPASRDHQAIIELLKCDEQTDGMPLVYDTLFYWFHYDHHSTCHCLIYFVVFCVLATTTASAKRTYAHFSFALPGAKDDGFKI